MGQLNIGPKHLISQLKLQTSDDIQEVKQIAENNVAVIQNVFVNKENVLKVKISELEAQLLQTGVKIVEVIKEIPVEIIKEIHIPFEKVVEVIKEKIVEKEIEIIKEVEVIKHSFVDKIVEVEKEVQVFIDKEIKFVPNWVKIALVVQTLLIIGLMLFK